MTAYDLNENAVNKFVDEIRDELIAFTQTLIRTKSYTADEREIAGVVLDKMRALGYDDAFVDEAGNVVGVIGTPGDPAILFDSHMDTVPAEDAEKWTHAPFDAQICDGLLYGRGAADMKGGLAASIYAGYVIKRLGLAKGKCVYVSASVMEEDFDGVVVHDLIKRELKNVCWAVLCEPTSLDVGIGHNGRALIRMSAAGHAAHGSHPEQGDNPIYKVAKAAAYFEKLNERIDGTVAVTQVGCSDTPTNVIPTSASIIVDRRLTPKDDLESLRAEMDGVCRLFDLEWEICDVSGVTWTGEKIVLHSYLPAWRLPEGHPLMRASDAAYNDACGSAARHAFFGFSTNAVATAGLLHIPSIVMGPGDTRNCHMPNEYCEVEQLIDACKFYAQLSAKNISE